MKKRLPHLNPSIAFPFAMDRTMKGKSLFKRFYKLLVLMLILSMSSAFTNITEIRIDKPKEQSLNLNSPFLSVSSNITDGSVVLFSDSKLKISYQSIICDGQSSIQLKVENISSSDLKFTYKLSFSETESKSISLSTGQILEGILILLI